MVKLVVHPRIFERHPELDEVSVMEAWENALLSAPRIDKNYDEYIVVGFDAKGRLLEMVGARGELGNWLIYHAMTPPSEKTYRELGIAR